MCDLEELTVHSSLGATIRTVISMDSGVGSGGGRHCGSPLLGNGWKGLLTG